MPQFEQPEVLATFDRSFGDRKEQLRFERGSYQGKPTYSLRLYWGTPDGTWRWSEQRATQSGKCWERLNLKQRELKELGEALLAECRGAVPANDNRRPARPRVPEPANEVDDDDIPF